MAVIHDQGRGAGEPIDALWSKNSTCCGLSGASPEVTTTQCRAQPGVFPLAPFFHWAAGSCLIALSTVSVVGPSVSAQPWVFVACGAGGFHPQPTASRARV